MNLVISIEALAYIRRWWATGQRGPITYTMSEVVEDLDNKARSAAAAWSILDDQGAIRTAHFEKGPIVALQIGGAGNLERPEQLNVIDLRIQ